MKCDIYFGSKNKELFVPVGTDISKLSSQEKIQGQTLTIDR